LTQRHQYEVGLSSAPFLIAERRQLTSSTPACTLQYQVPFSNPPPVGVAASKLFLGPSPLSATWPKEVLRREPLIILLNPPSSSPEVLEFDDIRLEDLSPPIVRVARHG
jgi:hypothetical protein